MGQELRGLGKLRCGGGFRDGVWAAEGVLLGMLDYRGVKLESLLKSIFPAGLAYYAMTILRGTWK